MSGQQIGTVVGAVVGAYFGYPQLGAAIGGYIGGVIDPTVIKGPSIGDAQQQTSLAGQAIPKCFGHCPPIAPTLIDGDKISRKYTKTQGGKGSTTETETEGFKAHRAFLVCEGEITGYARITRNGKLVYSTQPGDNIDADSASFASQITIYTGTETQGPDPTLESIHGVGNTPYYRGRSYFVVRDDDETQTGGMANQYRVEVVAAGTADTSCLGIYGDALFYFPLDDASPGGSARELIAGNNGTYSDTAGVRVGDALRAGSSGSFQMQAPEDCMIASYVDAFSTRGLAEWTISCYAQVLDFSMGGGSHYIAAAYWSGPTLGSHEWLMGFTHDHEPEITWSDGSLEGHGIVDPALSSTVFLMGTMAADGTFTLYKNGTRVSSILVDEVDRTSVHGESLAVGGAFFSDSYGLVGNVSDVAGWSRCFSAQEASAAAGMARDFLPLPDLVGAWVGRDGGPIINVCGTTVTAQAAVWKDIALEIAGRANASLPARMDIAEMTDEVPGFVLGNATLTATDYIRSLCMWYTVDLPEYDGKLHSVRRGGAVSGTFDPDDLLTVEDDDTDTRSPELQAFQRVTVMYPDPANNYVPTPQTAPRTSPDVTSNSAVTLQCPIPFDATTMAQKTDIMQKISFLQVEGGFTRSFPAEYSRYVQSDAIIFNDRRHLITKASNDDSMVRFECTYDRPSAYTSVAIGSVAPPPEPPTPNIKGPTILAAMNLPSLTSSANVPGVYLVAQAILPAWSGCDVYLSIDGGESESKVMTITDSGRIGLLAEDLGIGSNGEPIVVDLYRNSDQLESVTSGQIAAKANGFALISDDVCEVCQFQTATEDSSGHFELTDVIRGELGTTEAPHSTGDRFVMLDTAKFLPIDASLAGQTLIFRGVTRGTPAANNPTVSLVYDPPTFIIDGGEVTT